MEKQVTIDISFIPSITGYEIRKLIHETKDEIYSPQLFAEIICKFTQDVTPEWIVNNCEYNVLDAITAKILKNVMDSSTAKN